MNNIIGNDNSLVTKYGIYADLLLMNNDNTSSQNPFIYSPLEFAKSNGSANSSSNNISKINSLYINGEFRGLKYRGYIDYIFCW